jgi:glycosyltransferase involved in cell wall biosynthesis
MRIFQLVDDLGYGGAQEVVIGLALSLKSRGNHVEIGCLREAGNHPEAVQHVERSGIPVVPFQKPEGFHLPTLWKIREYLEAGDFDLVHSHNPLVHHYAAAAGRLARIPAVVSTLHGTATLTMQPWARVLFWASAMLSDRIVSVCPEVDDVFRLAYPLPPEKFAVVDNGIDLSRFLSVPERCPRREIVFGAVGRLVPVKNHRILIEAFQLATRRHSGIRLRILGGGPLEQELRQLVRSLNLTESVELCGYHTDVPGFLANVDVYVLPSDSEGLPMSLLEAIASGLPVIATEVGGVPGVVKRSDSGWLCPPGNREAMLAAMEAALQDQDLSERGERARRSVAEWYSVSRMTADYERLYQSLQQGRS